MDKWGTAGSDAVTGAAVGGTIGSAIPVVGTLLGAGVGAVAGGIYGFAAGSAADKAKKKLYRRSGKTAVSQNAAGSSLGKVAGAYRDVSLINGTELDPKQVDKINRMEQTHNTVMGVASAASSVVGGLNSAGAFEGAGMTSSVLQNGASVGGSSPAFTQNALPGSGSTSLIGGPTSTVMDAPGTTEALSPSTPKEATFEEPVLKNGGKNKSGSAPVEAEGGEIVVEFDNNHKIISKKPLVGPSHAQGGIDLKLPKNHAILNKDQQGRLNSGETLKSILDSIPNVNGVGKAVNGADNPPDGDEFFNPHTGLVNFSALFGTSSNAHPNTERMKQLVKEGKNPFTGAPTSKSPVNEVPIEKGVRGDLGTGTSDTGGDFKSNIGLGKLKTSGIGLGKYENPAFDLSGKTKGLGTFPNWKYDENVAGFAPKTPPQATFEDTPDMALSGWDDIAKSGGLFPQKEDPQTMDPESLMNPPDLSKTTETGSKFKFGYAEKKMLGDVAANLLTILQPKPQQVRVPNTPAGTPTMVTPRYQNPKATLDEVGRQINAGVEKLTQTGRTDMIPSLIASGIEATNKVGEQYAGINAEMETKAQSENARTSNQFSLTQSAMDADVATKNATLELERLKTAGLQDTERYKALVNLIYGPVEYDDLKQKQRMKDAVYSKLMADMYMRK